ncbi:hypothetical protein M409DRAFT_70911 [Zasmidium cellare ATCC 36951]|uniref:Uncharacterized protein n=1 Tax=Zasmidium cellare ATCC 36951 TaxID=1080233 RepID=A0A6A6C1L0_ZASCE|nr:uncharacterized protein M409DRAFT_70911 [Zasmidium cellare ATCC 36951]KAF2159596.1 hypothetical protein M409DRAFT_70911 [Zasmidium cellare ATCC 36951]
MFGICSSTNSTTGGNSSTSAVPTTITSSISQPTANSSSTVSSSMNISTTASSMPASTSASSSASSTSTPASAPSYSYAPTSSASATPSASPSGSPGSSEPSSQYTQFTGTGATSEGWPEQSKWVAFDTLFEMNRAIMQGSCVQFHVANDTDSEINDIKSAISSVSKSSGSNGCLRAPKTTSVDGIVNPGLLQTFQGSAMCNSGSATAPADVKTPCPASTIKSMIEQGTMGTTPGGMSLTYALKQSGATDVSKYYKAARIYNSGLIASSGLLQDGVATHCYASDIANRLLGWSLGPSKCTLNSF